jgi:hypothetical protein
MSPFMSREMALEHMAMVRREAHLQRRVPRRRLRDVFPRVWRPRAA